MSYFRSKEMGLYSLYIPRESGWKVLSELGCLKSLHFVDANPHLSGFSRPYYNYIKR